MTQPKPFLLIRHTDVSGISGTGTVAEGVQFTDGTVALRWRQAGTNRPQHVKPTTVIHDDIESVIGLHGHDGATDVVWIEAPIKATFHPDVDEEPLKLDEDLGERFEDYTLKEHGFDKEEH